MKLGIIGTGLIVKQFLPGLAQMDGLELVGIQSTKRSFQKAEELCSAYGIPHAVMDFDALCSTGMEAVYIAVPNHLHYEFCKKALQAGIHVIVEKPMTSQIEEARELTELAKEKGLLIFEAISTLHLKSYDKVRQWLSRIGEIKLVQSQFSQYSRRYDAFRKGELPPVFDPSMSGGALMDLNLYNLHFILGLFGEPERAEYFANVEREIDTGGIGVLKYPGFTAAAMAAKDCGGPRGAVIQGTKGCIRTEEAVSILGPVKLELLDGTTEFFSDEYSTREQYFIPEFQDFIRAVRKQDREYAYDLLEKSLAVSRLMTGMRRNAGIWFPADQM